MPSPCINVCRMNPSTQLCDGCLRTLGEIAAWSSASDDDKRAIWRDIETRHERLMAREREARESRR